jgi:hypothetical protein
VLLKTKNKTLEVTMKTSSAKAKARRLQDTVVALLLEHFRGQLEEGDLRPAIMGESGEDVKRSPLARKLFPFSIECKNREKINIWDSLKQAEDNCPNGDAPLLTFKRNRSEVFVALKFEDFINLLGNQNV